MNINYDEHQRYSQVPRRHDDRMQILGKTGNAFAGFELEVVQEHFIVLLHLEHPTLETGLQAASTDKRLGIGCKSENIPCQSTIT